MNSDLEFRIGPLCKQNNTQEIESEETKRLTDQCRQEEDVRRASSSKGKSCDVVWKSRSLKIWGQTALMCFKWYCLNAPGTDTPPSHSGLEKSNFSLFLGNKGNGLPSMKVLEIARYFQGKFEFLRKDPLAALDRSSG